MGKFFNNGSIPMKLHILNVLYDLESHAKDVDYLGTEISVDKEVNW